MKSKYLMIGAAVCAALFLFSGIMLWRQYAGWQVRDLWLHAESVSNCRETPQLQNGFEEKASRKNCKKKKKKARARNRPCFSLKKNNKRKNS